MVWAEPLRAGKTAVLVVADTREKFVSVAVVRLQAVCRLSSSTLNEKFASDGS